MSDDLIVRSLSQWEDAIGAEALNNLISTFSCPLNSEVENFLKNKAVLSAHLSASQSYLVCDLKTKNLLGYYTLVLKTYTVGGATLNSKNRRLIARFADSDSNGNFNAAVYLIAQIGKNYALPKSKQIPGDALIDLALDEFRLIKSRVGGKLVMVEREADSPKLCGFYNRNGFKSWTSRTNEKDGIVYDQMFAVLNDKLSNEGSDIGL